MGDHDMNGRFIVKHQQVMDTFLGRTVRSTIVDRAASHVDDPIAALFDPLNIARKGPPSPVGS